MSQSVSRIGTLEYLFVEMCVTSHKVLIGVMYKPLKVDDINVFDDLLQNLSPLYSDIILTGDFNEDVIARSSKTIKFLNVCQALSLQLVSSEPTHFSKTNSTSIDHFWTNTIDKVTRFSQISLPGISKHDLTFISYRCNMSHARAAPIMRRQLLKVNEERLIEDSLSIDWKSMLRISDVDLLVERFSGEMLNLLDVHAPLSTYQSRANCGTVV